MSSLSRAVQYDQGNIGNISTDNSYKGTNEKLQKGDVESLATAFDEARRRSYTARRQSGLDALGGASVLHFREVDLLREERERFEAEQRASADAHPLFAVQTTTEPKQPRNPIDPKNGDTVLQLLVPAAVEGGQRVRIELEAGGVISVKIPANFEEGDKFRVRVPVSLKAAAEKKNRLDREQSASKTIQKNDDGKQLNLVLPGQNDSSSDEDGSIKKKKKKKKKKEKKEKKDKKKKEKKDKKEKKSKKAKRAAPEPDSSDDGGDDDFFAMMGGGSGGGGSGGGSGGGGSGGGNSDLLGLFAATSSDTATTSTSTSTSTSAEQQPSVADLQAQLKALQMENKKLQAAK